MADIWPEVSPGTGGPEECFDGSVNCYEKCSWKFVSIHFTWILHAIQRFICGALMYSLRMKNLILKIDSSPALQIKMASSKVTSSLSRASEATKSTTGRRLESLCTREDVTQGRK